MDRAVNHFFNGFDADAFVTSGFNPVSEVEEFDNRFLISIDIPGVSKDDVKIEVADQKLVISGERKSDRQDVKARALGRAYGKFQKAFTLPANVDTEKIEADFENGVLTLSVPKAEAARPRTIEIKSGKAPLLS
jgi:HSP20 family protein